MSHRDTKMKPIVSNKWGDRFWLFQPNKSQATTRNNQGDTLGGQWEPKSLGQAQQIYKTKGETKGTYSDQRGENIGNNFLGDNRGQRETKAFFFGGEHRTPLQVMYPSRISSGAGLQLVNRYRFLFQRFRWGGIEVGETTDKVFNSWTDIWEDLCLFSCFVEMQLPNQIVAVAVRWQ